MSVLVNLSCILFTSAYLHYNGDRLPAVLWLWLLYIALDMELPGIGSTFYTFMCTYTHVVKEWFESLCPNLPPSVSMSKITRSDPSSLCWNDIEVSNFCFSTTLFSGFI